MTSTRRNLQESARKAKASAAAASAIANCTPMQAAALGHMDPIIAQRVAEQDSTYADECVRKLIAGGA
ncbi:hypothetical protein [Streptosporangium sp. NPDC003464]